MNQLIDNVLKWGFDKGIIEGTGTLEGQAKKMIEEANETFAAVNQLAIVQELSEKSRFLYSLTREHSELVEECRDGIGDTLVTLILLSHMLKTTPEECLQQAYDVISKRTGKMVDGTFVKDK